MKNFVEKSVDNLSVLWYREEIARFPLSPSVLWNLATYALVQEIT